MVFYITINVIYLTLNISVGCKHYLFRVKNIEFIIFLVFNNYTNIHLKQILSTYITQNLIIYIFLNIVKQ